jgi:hypothetical protein
VPVVPPKLRPEGFDSLEIHQYTQIKVLMYINNPPDPSNLQAVVLDFKSAKVLNEAEDTTDTKANNDRQEEPDIDQDDPLRDRVLSIALNLLEQQGEITIQDVVDASSVGESPIRHRMGQLVSMGKLLCAAGTGRRPNYYFLPSDNLKPTYSSDDMEFLEEIQQEELDIKARIANLQEKLDKLSEDKATIERSYQIKKQRRGNYE